MQWTVVVFCAARMMDAGAEPRQFDIPEGSAQYSVPKFVGQAGLSLMYEAGRLKPFTTRALKGNFEPLDALSALLEGSGLEFSVSSGLVISVGPKVNTQVKSSVPKELPIVKIDSPIIPGNPGPPVGTILTTVTAEDLVRAGVSTVTDWARALPSNFGGGATEDTFTFGREAVTNTARGSGMNLRGLGSHATLILVNGRRLAPSGSSGTFTDIANLPLSAIDHIEVMSSGASVMYGADAMGGVVNFVLRDDPASPVSQIFGASSAGAVWAKGGSQSVGSQWDRGRGVLSFEYYARDALPASARSQTLFPYGLNTDARYRDGWFLPQQERLSLYGSAEWGLTDRTSFFVDALVNRRRIVARARDDNATLQRPNMHPFRALPGEGGSNPTTMLYGFGGDPPLAQLDGRVDAGQLATGVRRALNAQWSISGTTGYAFERQRDVEHDLPNFSYEAMHGLNAGLNTPRQELFANALSPVEIWAYDSTLTYANLSGTGPLFSLPAGPVRVVFGSEYRVQNLRTSVSAARMSSPPETNRDRTALSVFAHSTLPLLGSDVLTEPAPSLQLSLGLRWEHFNDCGSAWSPLFGLVFAPYRNWTVQGTWVRLRRPPNLPDLNESGNTSEFLTLPDRKASPTGYTTALFWSGSNSHLHPETANNADLSVIFKPQVLDAEAGVTIFHSKVANRISDRPGSPIVVVTESQDQDWVTREWSASLRHQICTTTHFGGTVEDCLSAPIGIIVDNRLRNSASLVTDGLDWVSHFIPNTPLGRLTFGLEGTYVLRYAEAETPASPWVELRNTAHNPVALRLRASLGWEWHGAWASLASNYQGRYTDTDVVPRQQVDAWITWDLAVGYRIGSSEPRGVDKVEITLSAQNVFNQPPPYLNNAAEDVAYDEENGDLLGRRVSLALKFHW